MSWKMVWTKDERSESEIYGEVPSYPVGVLDRMPADFLARTKWANEDATTENDCVIFTYTDGRDPREDTGVNSFPSYKGIQPKRAVVLEQLQMEGREAELERRQVLPKCDEKFCVNRRHLVIGPLIRNQHRS